jgi:hypothetical protein
MNCDDNSKSVILPDEESAEDSSPQVSAIPKNYNYASAADIR